MTVYLGRIPGNGGVAFPANVSQNSVNDLMCGQIDAEHTPNAFTHGFRELWLLETTTAGKRSACFGEISDDPNRKLGRNVHDIPTLTLN
jgi:hypothetical protein